MSRAGLFALFVLSLFAAQILGLLLLPHALQFISPAWVVVVVAYWALFGPNYPVLSFAFAFGLLSDVAAAAPLGEHALGLVLVAYLCTNLRVRIGRYSTLQQALALIPVFLLYAVLLYWLDGMSHHPSDTASRFVPVLTSAALWPLICLLLDALGGRDARS